MEPTAPTLAELLDTAIFNALVQLRDQDPTSDEYAILLDRVSKLEKLKADKKPKQLSPDTKAMIMANLTGIVLIISHERLNVITTKATGLLLKLR